ncbi:MAG: hypothetical protein ACTSR2_06380 [Candidatus Hodarchaeales archaeon]
MELEEILLTLIPFLFLFILGILTGLPAFYYALRKLVKDWNQAKEDGDISEEEFDLLINDLIDIIQHTSNAYAWFIKLIKLKG